MVHLGFTLFAGIKHARTLDICTTVDLVPCLHMEVRPYSYFQWSGYF